MENLFSPINPSNPNGKFILSNQSIKPQWKIHSLQSIHQTPMENFNLTNILGYFIFFRNFKQMQTHKHYMVNTCDKVHK